MEDNPSITCPELPMKFPYSSMYGIPAFGTVPDPDPGYQSPRKAVDDPGMSLGSIGKKELKGPGAMVITPSSTGSSRVYTLNIPGIYINTENLLEFRLWLKSLSSMILLSSEKSSAT